MLDLVPGGRAQRQLVRAGQVPAPHRRGHREPARPRMRQRTRRSAAAAGQARNGPSPSRAKPRAAGRAAAERRRAEPEQRRRDHHEQQVLHHVAVQEQARERVERRGDRDQSGGQAGRETRPAARLGSARAQPARAPPAAQVDERRSATSAASEPGGDRARKRGAAAAALDMVAAGARSPRRGLRRRRGPGARARADAASRGTPPAPSSRRAQVLAVGRHVAAALDDLADELIVRSRVATSSRPARAGRRRPPSAWQLRHCLPGTRALPAARAACALRAELAGTGSALHASITGDHGAVVPSCVSVPERHGSSRITSEPRPGRRRQLFSPSPERTEAPAAEDRRRPARRAGPASPATAAAATATAKIHRKKKSGRGTVCDDRRIGLPFGPNGPKIAAHATTARTRSAGEDQVLANAPARTARRPLRRARGTPRRRSRAGRGGPASAIR